MECSYFRYVISAWTGSVSIPAEQLIEHFSGIFYTDREPLSFVDPDWHFDRTSDDGVFTDAELLAAITDLNGQAAIGPERIPSSVLKEVFAMESARAPLLALMNLCFVQGNVPADWGLSEIFVLYKLKGSREDPNNYRGINLINDFCKIYERLLEQRFQKWMTMTMPQGPMQFGFRKGTGTTEAYFTLSTVAKYFTRVQGLPCFTCFVDLKKAFPSVYRSSVLRALQEKGGPSNSIRALASLFSFNSCRLRVNSFLSRPFPINRGVKEGGINSPSVFVVVYALALERLDVHPLPANLTALDPNKVYYFVYADDLALLSCNLSEANRVLMDLDKVLPDYGMALNTGKTCWMPFLPVNSRFQVQMPSVMGMRIGSEWLECVDRFTYLGFLMNPFLGTNDHVAKKRELMFSAARCSGRMIRNLQITNLNSIRTFFFSLVASQQYGVAVINFQPEDFRKAAKIFLQTIFCLPDSFPYSAVEGLLRLRGFDLTTVQQRLAFLERGFRDGSMIAKVLDLDSTRLQSENVGLSHDLVQVLGRFFDVSDLENLNMSDFSYLQDLRDQIVIQLDEAHFLEFAQSTGRNFWSNLAEDAFIPRGFSDALGSLDFESVRVILLFLGDVFRYSMGASSSECPFCPIQLHAYHLFSCPNAPFRQELPEWQTFLQMFRDSQWRTFTFTLFVCLRIWMNQSNFFSGTAKTRISDFFQMNDRLG